MVVIMLVQVASSQASFFVLHETAERAWNAVGMCVGMYVYVRVHVHAPMPACMPMCVQCHRRTHL